MSTIISAIFSTVLQALLPLISLISGILSLYVDPRKDPKKKWLLVAVLVLSALATVGMSIRDDKLHRKEADALNTALTSTKEDLATVKGFSESTHSDVSTLLNCIAQKFGYSPESIRSSFADDSLIKRLTISVGADQQRATLLTPELRTDGTNPTVVYYAKAEEAVGVEKALREAPSLRVIIKKPLDVNPRVKLDRNRGIRGLPIFRSLEVKVPPSTPFQIFNACSDQKLPKVWWVFTLGSEPCASPKRSRQWSTA